METTLAQNGRIIIPAKLRKKFDIKKGTRFQIEVDENGHRIILKPITREYIHSLRGQFKGERLMKSLKKEKQREREL